MVGRWTWAVKVFDIHRLNIHCLWRRFDGKSLIVPTKCTPGNKIGWWSSSLRWEPSFEMIWIIQRKNPLKLSVLLICNITKKNKNLNFILSETDLQEWANHLPLLVSAVMELIPINGNKHMIFGQELKGVESSKFFGSVSMTLKKRSSIRRWHFSSKLSNVWSLNELTYSFYWYWSDRRR